MQTIAESNRLMSCIRDSHVSKFLTIRLANGNTVTVSRREVDLRLRFSDFDSVETFTLLKTDKRYDAILGMSWLQKHQPQIDWIARTVVNTIPTVEPQYFGALAGNDSSTEVGGNSNRNMIFTDLTV